jgi:hypothetical protein
MGKRPAAAAPDAPTVPEVERIAAIADPVIRNLEITDCYWRLAASMAARGDRCSNWCTFATWASRQAGHTVRGEDLLEELQRELGRGGELLHPFASLWRAIVRHGLFRPDTRLGRVIAELHTPFDAFELASDAVARGNRKVFAEIGLEFARYLQDCGPELRPESAEFQRFLEGLRPGPPPDGQQYLRQAFARYQQQRFEPDPKRRAELVALANLEIGLHEQTRLQPEISEALDVARATGEALGVHLLRSRLQREVTEISATVITLCVMVLTLPGAVLALGRNLDASLPEILRTLENTELEELVARFEAKPPAVDDCGARDWAELPQRMHYISHLFRSYHERAELGDAPFTPEQVERFRAGVVPDGEL